MDNLLVEILLVAIADLLHCRRHPHHLIEHLVLEHLEDILEAMLDKDPLVHGHHLIGLASLYHLSKRLPRSEHVVSWM